MQTNFPGGGYVDVAGLCRQVPLSEIETQGWSLSPARYVGSAEANGPSIDFRAAAERLSEELEVLANHAHALEDRIAEGISGLLSE